MSSLWKLSDENYMKLFWKKKTVLDADIPMISNRVPKISSSRLTFFHLNFFINLNLKFFTALSIRIEPLIIQPD